MSVISINQVLTSTVAGAPFTGLHRVLHFDKDQDVIVLIRLEAPFRQPFIKPLSSIINALDNSRDLVCTNMELPSLMLMRDDELPEHKKHERDQKWKRLAALLKPEYRLKLLFAETRGSLVAQFARDHNLTASNIYRDLWRYFVYGSTKNAFLYRHDLCGKSSKKPKKDDNREGPKPRVRGRSRKRLVDEKIEISRPYEITEEDKLNFEKAYKEYIRNEDLSVLDAYEKMMRIFYSTGWALEKDGVAVPIMRDPDKCPSLRQFRYWLNTTHDKVETHRKRIGEKRFEKDYRALLGSTQQEAYGPGARYQIDSTPGDGHLASGVLVNSYHRGWSIGRPIIYLVVDCFSQYIVGLHVATEGPSWNTARLALFNSFTNKVEYCGRHGVTIGPETWNASILPHKLLPDRAELLCESTDGMVEGLDIIMEYPQAYRGDLKGLIESRFHVFQGKIYPRMPGKISRNTRPGATKAPDCAALTLDEFTKILIELVIYYNQHMEFPWLRTAAMIEDEVIPTPQNIWNWGLKNAIATPHYEPIEKIYSFLLPSGIATIREDGIAYNGARYVCKRAIVERWFERARSGKTKQISIRYHPSSSNEIYLLNEQDGTFEAAYLMDADVRYKNRRFEEIAQLLEREKLESQQREQEHRQGYARFATIRDEIYERAEEQSKESRTNLPSQATGKGIRENRALEAQLDRQRELQQSKSYLLSTASPTQAKTQKTHDKVGQQARNNVIDLLVQKARR